MCLSDDAGDCGLDRRKFLKAGAASIAGFSAFANTVGATEAKPPPTRVLDDPRVEHGKVAFTHHGKDTFQGYLARPKASGTFPGVLVIAGNTINEEYIPNTCAALALAGFVGLAPDVIFAVGDNATPIEKAHAVNDMLEDVEVGADYLSMQPFVRSGGFGMVGFCFGGRLALLTAARSRRIRAVVAYHPGIVAGDRGQLDQVRAPVQLHQGTADHSVDPNSANQLRDILRANHVPVELFWYEGADHGFLAYTRQFYRPDYAELSWSRATKFLSEHAPS